MAAIECRACDHQSDDGDHWVHVSVFHHDDPDYDGDWNRDNPRNYAATLCPDCADAVIAATGGEP